MKHSIQTIGFCLIVACAQIIAAQDTKDDSPNDWANWRGPNSDGIIEGQNPPTEWSADKNVIWKTQVPGRGNASPTIVGDKILLATADRSKQTQSVLAFNRQSGEKVWETEVHSGNFSTNIHPKNTYASQTVVSDGTHAFVVFSNGGKIWASALTLDGEKVWQKEVGTYTSNRPFGFGTSPTFSDEKLFVTCEGNGESFIAALNPTDGEEIYRIDRPRGTSYSVPVVATVAGKRQLLMSGNLEVAGYNVETGESLWTAKAKWETSCGTMVWDGDLVFASGGFPAQQTLAIRADGSGDIVWENSVKVYEQSMILIDGYLYAQAEGGIIYCWRGSDGKEMWKSRARGPESASPVYAGGHIYFTNELGTTFVIKANPEEYELVATNQLGNTTFASMAMLDDHIYTRVGFGEGGGGGQGGQRGPRGRGQRGQRGPAPNVQEWLYCLGTE